MEAEDDDLVQAWRSFAEEADQHARYLERFIEAGWTVCDWGERARRHTDSVAEAEEIATEASLFASGHPIELGLADDDGGEPLGAGGLLVGLQPHPDFSPPRALPALIWVEPSGAQYVVEHQQDLREAVGRGLRDLALWLDGQQDELHELQAKDLPDALRGIAADVTQEGPVPRYVRVDMGEGGKGIPRPRIEVCAVSGAIWRGLSDAAGVQSTVRPVPIDGIGAQLCCRGEQLATDLRG